ncbi:MAG: hypothetical protein HY348_05825, partial [Nitrospira defluvii]|nr:hypothetical protein [Nitrospira defluvii]
MDRPLHTNLLSALQAEQVHVLYRNMPTGVLASAVNAAILSAVEWPVVPHPSLLLWVIAIWVLAGTQALLIFNYRRAVPSSWRADDWHRWMFVSTTLSGMGWGSSVFFFTPEIPLPYELGQIFVLGGMTAGAVSVLSVSFPLFISYALPVALPLLGHLFLSGHEFHLIMGIMGTPFLFATVHSAWTFNRVMLSSMSLRLEKLSLVQSLTTRTEAVDRLNQEITKEIHDRRVIEEQLRTAQGDLEQRIAERTADLARANASLQDEAQEHRRTEGALLSSEKRFNYLT